jgi:aryl-alcohol dehydrogenase-like predicted oxidoreductase
METRIFGRTGHASTVAIFGGAALGSLNQEKSDAVMELIISHGINHIDVAPGYGDAELRIGPWMPRVRDQFFLGCKTTERTREGAAAELRRSLERLQTDRFDLHQLHGITSIEDLDKVTSTGGALEALIEAREEGLTDYIGITGHGVDAPKVFLEALRRFDFDTVLFPINFVQLTNPEYRNNAEELIKQCRAKNVGTMVIKSITKSPWGDRKPTYHTWYEPYADPETIQQCVNFVLSHDVTGICTTSDSNLLRIVLESCENFKPISEEYRESLIEEAVSIEPLFT